MSGALYLGVDGGQSSTAAWIADADGRVIGTGSDGPCNHVQSAAEGREKFIRVIGGCVRAAAREAGLGDELPAFHAACLGFSGGPVDKEPILRELLRVEHLMVTTDALIALTGATGGEAGIITIAGTGSISFGRDAGGKRARAGGWGYAFGDEGGGYDIARRALQAILRYHEGWGPETSLHARLLETGGAREANELMHAFYSAEWPRERVAGLAKVVDEEAERGDAEAQRVLREAAAALVTITRAVRGQLFAVGDAVTAYPVGAAWRSRILREHFVALWTSEAGNAFALPRMAPAAGALLEAIALAGETLELKGVPEVVK